jgi:hypothetical protein
MLPQLTRLQLRRKKRNKNQRRPRRRLIRKKRRTTRKSTIRRIRRTPKKIARRMTRKNLRRRRRMSKKSQWMLLPSRLTLQLSLMPLKTLSHKPQSNTTKFSPKRIRRNPTSRPSHSKLTPWDL